MHSRKFLLFNNTVIWIKKNGVPDFDVTMGSFDGAELCELVGLSILHISGKKYGKQRIGLYRDDGLARFGYTNRPQADKIRLNFIKIFKEDFYLRITCETKMKAIDFLDVSLNLTAGKYQIIIHYILTFFLTILQIQLKIFQTTYLKELTLCKQMKQQ